MSDERRMQVTGVGDAFIINMNPGRHRRLSDAQRDRGLRAGQQDRVGPGNSPARRTFAHHRDARPDRSRVDLRAGADTRRPHPRHAHLRLDRPCGRRRDRALPPGLHPAACRLARPGRQRRALTRPAPGGAYGRNECESRARSMTSAIIAKSRSWASTAVAVLDATAAIMQSISPRGVTPARRQVR